MKSLKLLIVLIMGLIVLGIGYPISADDHDAALPQADPAIVDDLFNRLNALRTRYSREPYQLNPTLNAAAQDQAMWLVETGIRGHRRPDGSTPKRRVESAGYQYQGWCCGENYYMSIDATPDMVWNFWVWSRSHFINLTNRDFKDVGIGMTTDGYRISYVMVFATPFDPNVVTEPPPAAVPVSNPGTVDGMEHIVERGEILAHIAERYGVSIRALVTANGIQDPSLIYTGQRLVIPGVESLPADAQVVTVPEPDPAPPVEEGTHLVHRGETLARIAKRYGVSVESLAAANNISNVNLVLIGQVLVIPESEGE